MGSRRVFNQETGRRETVPGPVANHVWHCSLALHPDEGPLSDQEWAAIARDFMTRMGFTGADGKAECRWVAINHGQAGNGGDHIHIVAVTVREDGTKWSNWRDQTRAQKAVNAIEHAYGLYVIEAREHARGARADSAADLRASARRGRARTDRRVLEERVRAAAVAADTEVDFVVRLRELGVRARPRFAAGRTDVVVGYSVALHARRGEHTLWYAGGKVARDLSLPRLRARWPDTPHSAQQAVDAWRQAWRGMPARQVAQRAQLEACAQALELYDVALREVDPRDPVSLADATRDVAGLLSAQAMACRNGDAAELLARAARTAGRAAQTHRRPAPVAAAPAAVSLAASLALSAAANRSGDVSVLTVQTLALLDTLVEVYRVAGQARTADEMLEHATAALAAVHPSSSRRPRAVDRGHSLLGALAGTAGPVQTHSAPATGEQAAGPPGGRAGSERATVPEVAGGMSVQQADRIRMVVAAAAPVTGAGAPSQQPVEGDHDVRRAGVQRDEHELERVRRVMGLALPGGEDSKVQETSPRPAAPGHHPGQGHTL
ncbi:relaxase/mobilization nuclease domain-containing protein [Actinomyces howellii]